MLLHKANLRMPESKKKAPTGRALGWQNRGLLALAAAFSKGRGHTHPTPGGLVVYFFLNSGVQCQRVGASFSSSGRTNQ